jgi:hypothetical protein
LVIWVSHKDVTLNGALHYLTGDFNYYFVYYYYSSKIRNKNRKG